jgi:CBS domain-containing protein
MTKFSEILTLKASDIMTEEVATIRGSATVADAVKLMKLKQLRALIVDVRRNGDAYGILTHADVITQVVAYGKDPAQIRVHEIMTKPCVVVNPDLAVEYVARLFANTGIRIAPVIKGELLGVISESDILFKADFVENPKLPLLQRELATAIEEAKALAEKDSTSPACLEAWELVDDLEAESRFIKKEFDSPEIGAFQLFCDEQSRKY